MTTQQGILAPRKEDANGETSFVSGPQSGLVTNDGSFLQTQIPKEAHIKADKAVDIAPVHMINVGMGLRPTIQQVAPALHIASIFSPKGKGARKAQQEVDAIATALQDPKQYHPVAELMKGGQVFEENHPVNAAIKNAQVIMPMLERVEPTSKIVGALIGEGFEPHQARLAVTLLGRGDSLEGTDEQISKTFGLSHQDVDTKKQIKYVLDAHNQDVVHKMAQAIHHSSAVQRVVDSLLSQKHPEVSFFFDGTLSHTPSDAADVGVAVKARNAVLSALQKKGFSPQQAQGWLKAQKGTLINQALQQGKNVYDPSETQNQIAGVPEVVSLIGGGESRLNNSLKEAKKTIDNFGAFGETLDQTGWENVAKIVAAAHKIDTIEKGNISSVQGHIFGEEEHRVMGLQDQINDAIRRGASVRKDVVEDVKSLKNKYKGNKENAQQYLALFDMEQKASSARQKENLPTEIDYFSRDPVALSHGLSSGFVQNIAALRNDKLLSHSHVSKAFSKVQDLANKSGGGVADRLLHFFDDDIAPESLRKNLHSLSVIRHSYFRRSPVIRHGHHTKYGAPALVYSYYSKVVPAWLKHTSANRGGARLHMPHKMMTHGFPHMRKQEEENMERILRDSPRHISIIIDPTGKIYEPY